MKLQVSISPGLELVISSVFLLSHQLRLQPSTVGWDELVNSNVINDASEFRRRKQPGKVDRLLVVNRYALWLLGDC